MAPYNLRAMKIKDLRPEDRPRERMLRLGARYLSSTELLAILIGSGTRDNNVTQVAQELLSAADGKLVNLVAMPLEKLIRQKGIGGVKAITIAAALELGMRAKEESADIDKKAMTSPELIFRLMIPVMRHLDHEECWAVFLNRRNNVLSKKMICSGSIENTIIDTKRIVRFAIEKQAAGVILVHNHPSGSVSPSQEDVHQTDIVKKALGVMEIYLLDHIIISGGSFFSFAQEKVFEMH